MRLANFIVAAAVIVSSVGLRTRVSGADVTPDDWDPAVAAAYLDGRMDLWWQRAKTLRTGGSEVKCLSCHTAVPYLLARPALRQAMGVAEPTTHESRIADIARERVNQGVDDQPYYDHTPDKTIESAGVEAVVNALVLTTVDSNHSEKPSTATRAAMNMLWATQRPDGAWNWLNFGLEPYEAPDAMFYGAAMAAFAAGSSPGRATVNDDVSRAGLAKLRTYLRANHAAQHLFNRVWVLLASTRLDGVLTPDDRTSIVDALVKHQRPDGGWSLPDLGPWRWAATVGEAPRPPGDPDSGLLSQSDGFATGLIVYTLRQAGASTDDSVVRRGQEWLRTRQQPKPTDDGWAPWRAHSLNHDRENGGPRGEPWRRMFMSDLATAFAALALL